MAVRAVCFSPDSKYVVSGSDDKKINILLFFFFFKKIFISYQ
jgi:WD40 repeat protein